MNIVSKLYTLVIKKTRLKKIHWILASHAFSVMLFLIFLTIIFGIFLFYKYVVWVEAKEQEVANGTVKFEYNAYQEIIKKWQAKEQILQESMGKNYSNPFK